ncbi:MAG: transposase [Pseudomonadota bacterium]|nr:transposase [Pseudomonadota bacterium]
MKFYAGVDVSLRTVAICKVDEKGRAGLERSVPFEIADIEACLRGWPHSQRQVGFEVEAISQHLFSGLKEGGFEVVCMEARQVDAALSAVRNKTDRADARGIVQILRSGWFSPVHMKSREAHAIRALLTSR